MDIKDPEIKKQVANAMKEISHSMTRIEAERDFIKEAINRLVDEYELPKKSLNKMARVYHKETFTKELEDQDEFQTLYESILGPQTDEDFDCE